MTRVGILLVLIGAPLPAAASEFATVRPWTPPAVSSPAWESHPAVDPRTGDLWFVRSDATFSGWRLQMSACVDGRWTRPVAAPVAGAGVEADPWFEPDGAAVWFISARSRPESGSAGLDIWRASRRTDGGWSAPERLPEPVNSDAAEWFPRLSADGWLYFGSRRSGGRGKDDIWRARREAGGWRIENLGSDVNTAGGEYELEPARNGRWGVLSTDQGLYRVIQRHGRWRRAGRLGPPVNRNGSEIGPLIAPGGGAMLFSRDARGGASGELFVAGRSPPWWRHCGPPGSARAGPRRGRR